MLTLQECIDLSGLEVEEIEAIARHERIPEIVAAELGNPTRDFGWPPADPADDRRQSFSRPPSRRLRGARAALQRVLSQ